MASGQLTFTDQGSNTLRISAGSCLLRSADDESLKLVEYQLAQQDVTIPADTARYVGVQYNSGSPNFVVKTTDSWNDNSDFRVCQVYNEGGTLHIYPRLQRSHNLQRWLTHRLQEVEGLKRADYLGGLILSESADGNRYVEMSGGELYVGLEEFTISAFDTSGSDRFDSYYRDSGSGFTKVASQQTWNNSHYDDGTGTLNALGTNKYMVNWFYLETDDEIVHIYGRNEYSTLTGALAETPPATLPGRLDVHGVLLGGIIIQQGQTTAEDVKTSFTEVYGPASVTDHGSIGGLGDDDHQQYLLADGSRLISSDISIDGVLVGTVKAATLTLKTNQSIANATSTVVNFTGATGPYGGTWCDTTNDIIVPDISGRYLVICYAKWASNSTGYRFINAVGGAGYSVDQKGSSRVPAAITSENTMSEFGYFDGSNDQMQMYVYQTSGGALNLAEAYLTIVRIEP